MGRHLAGGSRRYYLKDRLGSVRAVVDESGGAVETRDHYPTGHELDGETGLVYAGARYLMPALGRWNATDPFASDYPAYSPYNYTLNNPLRLIDPDGKTVYYVDGEEVYDDGSDNGLVVSTTQEVIDDLTDDEGTTDWDGVRNADASSTEIIDSEKYSAWMGRVVDAAMDEYDGSVKVSIDNRGNVSVEQPMSVWEMGALTIGPFAITRLFSGLASLRNVPFQFGKDSNQLYHAFRHTDQAGLSRVLIKKAVKRTLRDIGPKLRVGETAYESTIVQGRTITFSAHKLPNGVINVGRITVP